MATMGRGKVRPASGSPDRDVQARPETPTLIDFTRPVITLGESVPITPSGAASPVLGVPIMREGFVTDTGYLTPPLGAV